MSSPRHDRMFSAAAPIGMSGDKLHDHHDGQLFGTRCVRAQPGN
jgi:hypothetical protein